jgi:hypothetical protein
MEPQWPKMIQPAGGAGALLVSYKLSRLHRRIRMTPAMAAGTTRKPWSMADVLAAAQATAMPGPAGPAILQDSITKVSAR